MKEKVVKDCVKKYFEDDGYVVWFEVGFIDVVAQSKKDMWIIEAKGEWKTYSTSNYPGSALHILFGQIVSRMRIMSKNRYYAVALPYNLLCYFHSWGAEGIRLLNIYLLVVYESRKVELWNPEQFADYVESLEVDSSVIH